MKLTEFLSDVGRPVAYYPELKKITGSTTATILLCQFIYWRGKEADPDGWLKKSSEEIESETGLSYNEQKTARKLLVSAGLMEEYYARLDHDMKFRLNLDEINQKWGKLKGNVPERDDSTFGNDGFPHSLNSNTETTTENIGTKVPMSIENQVYANVEYIEMPNPETAKRLDFANLVAMGTPDPKEAREIALAFQNERNITLPTDEKKIKGQRKAISEMLGYGVTARHVVEAVKKLLDQQMTFVDLFGVAKSAIDLATKPMQEVEMTRLL